MLNILTSSKRRPIKIESDRGTEFYNSIFQNFLKVKNKQHYSRFTDNGPSIAERVIETIRNLLKKPVFLAGNFDWVSELPFVFEKFNNTFHSSSKMKPINASKKVNEKKVFSSHQGKRKKHNPRFQLGQLVRTAGIKKVFNQGDTTNWSYRLYTITEVIHDIISSYRVNYLPERYNENLFRSTNFTPEKNSQIKEKLKPIQ